MCQLSFLIGFAFNMQSEVKEKHLIGVAPGSFLGSGGPPDFLGYGFRKVLAAVLGSDGGDTEGRYQP